VTASFFTFGFHFYDSFTILSHQDGEMNAHDVHSPILHFEDYLNLLVGVQRNSLKTKHQGLDANSPI